VVAPYLDLDSESESSTLVTPQNVSSFVLSGSCGDRGGEVRLIAPVMDPAPTATCSPEGIWSLTLNLSSWSDGAYDFKVRHTRAQSSRYADVAVPRVFKITQLPGAPSPTTSSAAVQPGVSGSSPSFVVSWELGLDSAGQPLVSYEYSLLTGDQQTVLTQWTSVGSETQATIRYPMGAAVMGTRML